MLNVNIIVMKTLSMFLRRATAMVRSEFFPPLVLSTCSLTETGESIVRQLQTAGDASEAEDCPRRVPHVPIPAWVPHDCTAAVVVTATVYSL
jgi:hypothetical protein